MRVGLLSDIHANAHALQAILKKAKSKKIDKILCCGDYVGYYYEPDYVINLLDQWDWIGIAGNHESMLLDWLNKKDRNEIKKKYGSGISVAAKKLDKETIFRLCRMPHSKKIIIDNFRVLLCHGSPWDRDLYVYPDAGDEIKMKLFEYNNDIDIIVYGHTHYPVIWKKNSRIVINPGSVGQPRDREIGASWVLWDTKEQTFEFLRERYDVSNVVEMCKKFWMLLYE